MERKTVNENRKKSGDLKMIIGGIALIVVLFIAVKLIFWGLEQMIPRERFSGSAGASVSADVSASGREDAPGFCVHCGGALPDSFQWGQFCPWCGEKNER